MFIPIAVLQSFSVDRQLWLDRGTGRGRDHADGVLPSANVPRRQPSAAGSSFISLREARHRRDPVAQGLVRSHDAACPVPRASGVPRSEIKEEAAGRGTFAEGNTRWPRHAPRSNLRRSAPTETNCKETSQ